MTHRVGFGAIDHGDAFLRLQRPSMNEPRRSSTRGGMRRPRGLSNRLVFALMILTSMLAVFDLYLLASSALH